MAPAFTLMAAAMLLAASVNAQCPTCDPNNGAQVVCAVDTTTNSLQQFVSLCEMDLFNCQNNRNIYQPLYYGACTTSTTNTAYQPTYTQTVSNYPLSTGTNYYPTGSAAAQPNYAYSGTDANGDWSVRLLSNINPAFFANRGTYQSSSTNTGNTYQYVPRTGTGSVSPTVVNGGTTTSFVPSSGSNGYQAGSVNSFAPKVGGSGSYVGSKTGVISNTVGGKTVAAVRNPVPSGVKTWASNKGSAGVPVPGRFASVLGVPRG